MRRNIFIILLSVILNSNNFAYSQNPTQTIKGKVFDSETQIGLPGATIVIIDSYPLAGTSTDVNGFFRLENVPVGRVTLQISFVGYESGYISNLLVGSGKEVVLNIPLKESFSTLTEVVVKPDVENDKAINKMATLSARTFSVEEAQRYAGGFDDPSRLASSFAGVTPGTIDNNEIVIRGNAAKGILWRIDSVEDAIIKPAKDLDKSILWRIDGVEVPAPNHLAGLFSGGGVNMMFSTTMLANSDFLTAAFPAEYGNTLSGVFDLNLLRTGNSDKRETIFQFGSYGVELATEGPFKKGKRASYLISYRYSTFGILEKLLPQVTGLPTTSDLSFKLNFPTKKAGVFSLWSINGKGKIAFNPKTDSTKRKTNYDNFQYDIHYDLTASGFDNRKIIGNKSYLFTSVSYSATRYTYQSTYLRRNLRFVPVVNQNEVNSALSFL